MKQFRKNITREENFILWEKYQTMFNYSTMVVTFVDNNVLQDEPEYFKGLFQRYEDACEAFYREVEEICKSIYDVKLEKLPFFQWDIDFAINEILLTLDEDRENEYGRKDFALNYLNLLPQFRTMVESIIE